MDAIYRHRSMNRAMHYAGAELSPREQYYKYADGRDDGLRELDPDSAEAFALWYWIGSRGGHPWEVCRSGIGVPINLCVRTGKTGYYLMVDGSSEVRTVEAIQFCLALHRTGLPVCMQDADILKERLTGEEWIGIVPAGVEPLFCDDYFPGQKIMEFMNLPTEKAEEFAALCHWRPITVSGLKEKPGA